MPRTKYHNEYDLNRNDKNFYWANTRKGKEKPEHPELDKSRARLRVLFGKKGWVIWYLLLLISIVIVINICG